MSRPNPAILAVVLAAIVALLGGVALAKGGLLITRHETDTLHLLQIVFRLAAGQWPHQEFVTPIGVLAFAPVALFLQLGAGVGQALILAQILVAVLFLPALVWSGYSRFEGALAYVFGALVLVLTLALIYGEGDAAVSISMHYNRWAWAASFIAIVLAALPPRETRADTADGVFIGFAMAALALCKATFFVAFAGPVALALVFRGAFRSLGVALVAGLVVALVVTLAGGLSFWEAYVGDLREVAGSGLRPEPGASLSAVATAPENLGATLALLAAVIFLRQAGEVRLGLILLLLAPGFVYVTWQNFGNDPKWLWLVGVLVLAHRPAAELRTVFGWSLRGAMTVTAAAVFAFAAPSMLNLAVSPFRHLNLPEAEYVAMLPRIERHRDLRVRAVRAARVDGRVALDGPESGLGARAGAARREETAVRFQGERLPDCELQLGLVAWLEAIVGDMEGAGYGDGARVFGADVVGGYWLYGNLRPLPGGAPWYYDGLPGFGAADYLLVPLCPISVAARKRILDLVTESGTPVTELRRTPLYILYRVGAAEE